MFDEDFEHIEFTYSIVSGRSDVDDDTKDIWVGYPLYRDQETSATYFQPYVYSVDICYTQPSLPPLSESIIIENESIMSDGDILSEIYDDWAVDRYGNNYNRSALICTITKIDVIPID